MPAVAQINVNFANRNEFTLQIPEAGVATTKSISPYTLVSYMLYNREDGTLQPPSPQERTYLSYEGGFITAGDKVNVKHSNLQLRRDVDIERSLYVDKIFSRRKGNTDTTYEDDRAGILRSIILSPDNANERTHYIEINAPSSSNRTIELRANTSTIRIENTSSTNIISLSSTNLDIINTQGLARITGKLDVTNDVSFQKNVKIVGESTGTTLNAETFEIRKTDTVEGTVFRVRSHNGDVNFTGDLNINNKFTVDSDTGNTVIGSTVQDDITGDLSVNRDAVVNRNFKVKGFSEFEDYIYMNNGNSNAETRRIRGVRRVANITDEIRDPSSIYLDDALAIGDLRTFFLEEPVEITTDYTLNVKDNQKTILVNSSNNITISVPLNLPRGTQISFIRVGSGEVHFRRAGANNNIFIRTTPTSSFTRLAFQNSVATIFCAYTNQYYLFGDLLPFISPNSP
jgi:hypothetical protein